MMTTVLIALALIILVFLVIVALQPSTFHVERSIEISASPEEIFPHLNDLMKTQAWSPWAELDPQAKYSYDGPPSGIGASSSWVGNKRVGEGRQTIVESHPNELVRIKLEFMKPFESTCSSEYRLKAQGDRTTVSWLIFGSNNFLSRAFCLFMNQDKMIGGQFEKGLKSLKALVELKR